MKIFLYNAIYLVGLGLLLGNILGLGICFLQQYTHIFKLDQTNYYLAYVPIEVHLEDVLLLNLATVRSTLQSNPNVASQKILFLAVSSGKDK